MAPGLRPRFRSNVVFSVKHEITLFPVKRLDRSKFVDNSSLGRSSSTEVIYLSKELNWAPGDLSDNKKPDTTGLDSGEKLGIMSSK